MKLNTSEATQQPLPDEVKHKARLLGIVDLGTQKGGQFGDKPKIQFFWELSETLDVFVGSEDKGEQPHIIKDDFNASFGERSNLRKRMEKWLGKAITPEQEAEIKEHGFISYLGKAGKILIEHNVSEKNGITYPNVVTVTPVTDKDGKVAKLINTPFLFDMDKPEENYYGVSKGADGKVGLTKMNALQVFDKLYPWLQKKIALSPEWIEISKGKKPAAAKAANPRKPVEMEMEEEVDDDLPY